MYKKALKNNLTFESHLGILTLSQVVNLNKSNITQLIKDYYVRLQKSELPDFLVENQSTENSEDQLRYDILVDLYQDIVDKETKDKKLKEIRDHNQKILRIIADKKDHQLTQLGIDDLEKLLRNEVEDRE